MAYSPLDGLILKLDTQEIIRDQIVDILQSEVQNQMTLATNAALNPALWELEVYAERSNPWDEWVNEDFEGPLPVAPIVNVSVNSSTIDGSASGTVEFQRYDGIFDIEIFGYGRAQDDGATGQIAGDKYASFECQRATRLVRNILMAAKNSRLQLTDPNGCNLIGLSQVSNIQYLNVPIEPRVVHKVKAARMQLSVKYNETAEQVTGENLEQIFIEVFKKDDGSLYFDQLFDYT